MENFTIKKLQLTKKQKELLSSVETIFAKLQDNGIELIYNADAMKFYAINAGNIKKGEFKQEYDLTEEDKKKTLIDPFELDEKTATPTIFDFCLVIPSVDAVLVVDEFDNYIK